MTDTVLTEREDDVLTVTMNRPEAMNALTPELLGALSAAIEDVGDARVLVLRGAGRAFTAGVDLKVLREATFRHGHIAGEFDDRGVAVGRALRACPVPTIAQVRGACFTGGLEIALSCDFVLTTASSKLGDTHAKFGLRPSWGMSQALPDAVGLRRARELSFTGRTFTGEEAARWGLANEAFADEAALEAGTRERCAAIVANSAEAIAAYKDLYALAAERRAMPDALTEELARDYPGITDTDERLAGFKA